MPRMIAVRQRLGHQLAARARTVVDDGWIELIVVSVAAGLAGVSLRKYIAPDYKAEWLPPLNGLSDSGLEGYLTHLPGYPGIVVAHLPLALFAQLLSLDEASTWRFLSAFAISALAARRARGGAADARAGGAPRAGLDRRWDRRRLAGGLLGPADRASRGGARHRLLLGAVVAAARERPIIAGILLGIAGGKSLAARGGCPDPGAVPPPSAPHADLLRCSAAHAAGDLPAVGAGEYRPCRCSPISAQRRSGMWARCSGGLAIRSRCRTWRCRRCRSRVGRVVAWRASSRTHSSLALARPLACVADDARERAQRWWPIAGDSAPRRPQPLASGVGTPRGRRAPRDGRHPLRTLLPRHLERALLPAAGLVLGIVGEALLGRWPVMGAVAAAEADVALPCARRSHGAHGAGSLHGDVPLMDDPVLAGLPGHGFRALRTGPTSSQSAASESS